VTLNDLEWRNGLYFAIYSAEFGGYRGPLHKVVDLSTDSLLRNVIKFTN